MVLPTAVFDGVIDVSHNNGAIDWPTVAASGIVLAFVKASEGAGFADPRFAGNRTDAIAAGLLVVPYHFIDTADPAVQARHFLSVAGLSDGDPAMLDWETEAPVETLVAIGAALAAATRRDPVGYYGWAQLSAPDPVLSRWPLMVPAYPRGNVPGRYATLVTSAPRLPPGRAPTRPYDFHQYTPAGQVPGIAGPVDRSIWVGAGDQLREWHASGALPAG